MNKDKDIQMTTQRIQLDISSDVFDKVMFFLENLPKNKVKLNFLNNTKKYIAYLKVYFLFGSSTRIAW